MLAISVRKTDHGELVSVFVDDEGIKTLVESLHDLKSDPGGHTHLLSSFAGGSDLDRETPTGHKAVDEVILNYI